MENNTLYGDFKVKLVSRSSRDSTESNNLYGDFKVKLVWR